MNTKIFVTPPHVQTEVQKMNRIFDTPAKRAYVADKVRLNLSDKTKRDFYSESLAESFKLQGLNNTNQDEYAQKIVAFYFYAQQVYYNGKSMLDDFIVNNGKITHYFSTYR